MNISPNKVRDSIGRYMLADGMEHVIDLEKSHGSWLVDARNNKEYLECLFNSDKPLIIYRAKEGFDIFTDFSRRIDVTTKNAKFFFNQTTRKRNSRNKFLIFGLCKVFFEKFFLRGSYFFHF